MPCFPKSRRYADLYTFHGILCRTLWQAPADDRGRRLRLWLRRRTIGSWRRTGLRPMSSTTCSIRSSACVAPDPFNQDSLHYNDEHDYYVCPMGQHMERIGTGITVPPAIQDRERKIQGKKLRGCPLRGSCSKAKGNRVIEVNHRLPRNTRSEKPQ